MYLKYLPVTFSMEGSRAQYKVVCAPCLGLFTNGQNNGLRNIVAM